MKKENEKKFQNLYKIHQIKKHFDIINLHEDNISFMVLLKNKNIATASLDGSISICQINLDLKMWTQLIKIKRAHDGWTINHLCEHQENFIISCSNNGYFKIWELTTQNTLILISSIQGHACIIYKVLSLNNNRITTISGDKTIKFWDLNTYTKIQIPFESFQHYPCSICKLETQNEVLCISCCNNFDGTEGETLFYNSNCPYELKRKIHNIFTIWQFGLIELTNGDIALSRKVPHVSIIIIDSKKFEVVDEIIDEECFNPTFYGSLCSLDDGSFVYAIMGYFCHIEKENGKYKVMFSTRESMYGLYGFGGILLSDDRRYILSSTNYRNENIYYC